MRVDNVTINRSVAAAKKALEGLTTNEGENENARCKACCVCDRLIKYGTERVMSLQRLKNVKAHFKPLQYDRAKASYRVKCYDTDRRRGRYGFLHDMLLSPRSYRAKTGKGLDGMGCCADCHAGLGNRGKSVAVLPPFAIANGWSVGTAPKCLTDLNEVEVAIISPARINKHVFAFQAGSHRTIKGWHSLYYNDLSHFEAVQEHVQEIVKTPTISVVLVGPFTTKQRAITLKRTTVRWSLVRKALAWLKQHNPLYEFFTMPNETEVTPIVVDER